MFSPGLNVVFCHFSLTLFNVKQETYSGEDLILLSFYYAYNVSTHTFLLLTYIQYIYNICLYLFIYGVQDIILMYTNIQPHIITRHSSWRSQSREIGRNRLAVLVPSKPFLLGRCTDIDQPRPARLYNVRGNSLNVKRVLFSSPSVVMFLTLSAQTVFCA